MNITQQVPEEVYAAAGAQTSIQRMFVRDAYIAALNARAAGVLDEVRAERGRQDAKWGEQNHPDGTGPDFVWSFTGPANWVAECAKRETDRLAEEGLSNWLSIALEEVSEAFAESDPAALRAELIQCAAVFTQWAEAIDRREAELTGVIPGGVIQRDDSATATSEGEVAGR